MKRFLVRIITLIVIVIAQVSCIIPPKGTSSNDNNVAFLYLKIDSLNERITGRDLGKVLKEKNLIVSGNKTALLIHSRNDCSSCVTTAGNILCELYNTFGRNIFEVSSDSSRYIYPCPTVSIIDESETIKGRSNIFLTPSILILQQGRIIDVLTIFYPSYDDQDEMNIRIISFLKSHINNNSQPI